MSDFPAIIKVQSAPATLNVNFEAAKKWLSERLERFTVVVTQDTVKDAKKLLAELRSEKRELNTLRKDKVAEVSEPIRLFDNGMKDLGNQYGSSEQLLKDQISKFEQETKNLARKLLVAHRNKVVADYAIRDEFAVIDIEGLVKLTSVTATGNLSGPAKKAITAMVMEKKAYQDRTDLRLVQLEARSYRDGLYVPLTRDHVEPFLFADDDEYDAGLTRIITAELGRQEKADEVARKKLEKENNKPAEEPSIPESGVSSRLPAREDVLQAAQALGTDAQPGARRVVHKSTTPAAPEGKIKYLATCTFEVTVGSKVSAEAIEAELRKVMKAAGIKSLASVTIAAI